MVPDGFGIHFSRAAPPDERGRESYDVSLLRERRAVRVPFQAPGSERQTAARSSPGKVRELERARMVPHEIPPFVLVARIVL